MTLTAIPPGFQETRDALHRVATHVLARRRFDGTGKIGLRAAPGGFATPAFGHDHETLRIAGTHLVRDVAGARETAASLDLATATLSEAAAFASVDLQRPFDAGTDTPPLGDVDAPLAVCADAAHVLATWFDLTWRVLDATLVDLGVEAEPSVVQLWPEHFDAAFHFRVRPQTSVNVGGSPGDEFSDLPYVYVGPWTEERPGDPSYWDAPFGATIGYEELRLSGDPSGTALRFIARGLELLAD